MSGTKSSIALQASGAALMAIGAPTQIVLSAEGGAPEWIMVFPLPKGGLVTTIDGRGPYRVADLRQLATASMKSPPVPLAIDENHSIDIAAPQGRESPARGWITELQTRQDGIYGRVDWTETGRALLKDKAYRGISPAFCHDANNQVLRILRASLTNTPNLHGIAALHSENNMDLLAKLRKILGLADDADEAAIIAALNAKCGAATSMQAVALAAGLTEAATGELVLSAVKTLKSAPALQTVLAPIAKAAGLKDDADAAAILTGVTALAATAKTNGSDAVLALQTELKDVTTKLNTITTTHATERSTTYVDGQIAKGRVGVKPLRDHYIARHAASAEGATQVVKEIEAMPTLGPSGALVTPPAPDKDGKIALSAEQSTVAKMLGQNPEDMRKTLAAERAADAA